MLVKKYRLITKDGRAFPQLFDTIGHAVASSGTAGIQKLEEVNMQDDDMESSVDSRSILIISRQNNSEVEQSHKTGYAPTVNRPSLSKIFQNMPVLEVGEDCVLESQLSVIGRYDQILHPGWDGGGKKWEWVLYHPKGKRLTIDEAKQKYGDFDKSLGKDGNIVYALRLKA